LFSFSFFSSLIALPSSSAAHGQPHEDGQSHPVFVEFPDSAHRPV
jgi:hypothetical protein